MRNVSSDRSCKSPTHLGTPDGLEGLSGCLDGNVDVGTRRLGYLGDDLAIGLRTVSRAHASKDLTDGRDDLDEATIFGIDKLAVPGISENTWSAAKAHTCQ